MVKKTDGGRRAEPGLSQGGSRWWDKPGLKFLATPGGLGLVAVLIVAIIPLLAPTLDPDFWWHIETGKILIATHSLISTDPYTYTAVGHAWVMHEWGWEVMAAALYGWGGSGLIVVSLGLITWLGVMLIVLRTRLISRVGVPAICLGVGLILLAGLPLWGPRVQMVTFTLTGFTLFMIERHLAKGGKWIWVLVPTFLIWSNLHSGFTFGLILLGLTLVVETIDAKIRGTPEAWKKLKTLGLVTLGCLVAALINPNGPQILGYAFATIYSPVQQALIQEWQSPNFHNANVRAFEFMFFLIIVLFGINRKIKVREGVYAVFGLGLALESVRDIELFLILAGPVLIVQLDLLFHRIKTWRQARGKTFRIAQPSKFGAGVTAVTGIGLLLAVGIWAQTPMAVVDGSKTVAQTFPVCATQWLESAPDNLKIFNNYGDGGYLILHLHNKGDKVFIFGDAALMGDALIEEYAQTIYAEKNWEAPILNSGTQVVVFPDDTPLASLLAASKDFTKVYQDHTTVAYEPTDLLASLKLPTQPALSGVCAATTVANNSPLNQG